MNENENTMYPNLCDTIKSALTGNFTAVSTYIKKYIKVSNKQPNNAFQRQTKPKVSRRKEIKNIRDVINELETIKYKLQIK